MDMHPSILNRSLLFIIALLLLDSIEMSGQNGQLVISSQYKSSIAVVESADGANCTYSFYDNAGRLVKQLRYNEFRLNHPIRKFSVVKNNDRDHSLPDYLYPLPYDSTARSLSSKTIAELQALKKYGMMVKHPQSADAILYGPYSSVKPVVTAPTNKYVTAIETTLIIDYAAEENPQQDNALLNCSYLTVYNNLGKVVKKVLVPDKLVASAIVSDDGKYLLCVVGHTFVWDEGLSEVHDGLMVIDLQSGKRHFFEPVDMEYYPPNIPTMLFAGDYFQMTLGNPNSGEACARLYVNPYKKNYYLKQYDADPEKKRKPVYPLPPFKQFEGAAETPELFQAVAY